MMAPFTERPSWQAIPRPGKQRPQRLRPGPNGGHGHNVATADAMMAPFTERPSWQAIPRPGKAGLDRPNGAPARRIAADFASGDAGRRPRHGAGEARNLIAPADAAGICYCADDAGRGRRCREWW